MKIKVKNLKFTSYSLDFVVKQFIKQVRLDYSRLITGILSLNPGDIKDISPNLFGELLLNRKMGV